MSITKSKDDLLRDHITNELGFEREGTGDLIKYTCSASSAKLSLKKLDSDSLENK